jgi:hypothetical protein
MELPEDENETFILNHNNSSEPKERTEYETFLEEETI